MSLNVRNPLTFTLIKYVCEREGGGGEGRREGRRE